MLKVRAPRELYELVEKFRINEDYHKSVDYLETQVRVEFINPLLRLLGWDVDNEDGHGKTYKDVIHELHIGDNRHIDYVFKVGDQCKFILEAKRPRVDLSSNMEGVLQARQYAHDEKVPLAAFTDFEEMYIYQGHSKRDRPPQASDGHNYRLLFNCKFDSYAKHWSFLATLLSKKSVMLGIHDQLLVRLDEVRRDIGDSVFISDGFVLLKSIAQSMVDVRYSVEQDLALPRKEPVEKEIRGDWSRLTYPPVNEPTPQAAFSLAPLYY